MVDVYYGGRFLLSTLAEYTPEHIRFRRPRELVERIPTLSQPEDAVALLRRDLETHSDRVCVRSEQPLCGRLDPADIGVIFDERRFRVDVFIHHELLVRPDPGERRYLPPPDHDNLTLVQNLRSLYTNNSGGEERYSLFGRSRVGKGNQFGFANWVSTQEQSISVDELGYRNDFQDHQLTVGLFETSTGMLRALPRQPLVGASFGRSLQLRADLEAAIASPIELFLPSRSRVDIFRDGRLVSSAFYEVGNQLIDTSRLPAGSYSVDIVITDSSGEERVEQQLFVKSSLLAPPGESLWFVDLGRVRNRAGQDSFPADFGSNLLRAGYRWRQNSRLGFGVAGASTGDDHLGEFSANLLFDGLQAGGEVFASDEGGWGYSLRAASRWRDYNLSVNMQRVRADDPLREPFTAAPEFRLLPVEQRLYSAQLTRPLLGGQLGLNVTERQQVDGSQRRRSNLEYSRGQRLGYGQSLQWRFEVGEEEGDWRGQLTLQWRNTRGNWRDNTRLAYSESQLQDARDGVSAGIGTRWRDSNRFAGDLSLGARLDTEPGGRRSAAFDGDHRSAYGRANAAMTVVDNREQSGGPQVFSLLGYDTSLVVGEERRPLVGGPSPAESGVVLDLRDAPGANFDVMVNGGRHTSARGGSRVAITLPSYTDYRLRLANRGASLVSFDPAPYQFALYPGQVVTRSWELTTVNVLVGRIYMPQRVCDADGDCETRLQALEGVPIEGADGYAVTDVGGFLQAEVDSRVTELRARVNGRPCSIDLSGIEAVDSIMRAPRLLCVPEAQ